jgi:hypothetical protein
MFGSDDARQSGEDHSLTFVTITSISTKTHIAPDRPPEQPLLYSQSLMKRTRGESHTQETNMRKIIISALAVASVLTAVATANAGYWVPGPYGPIYVPTCVATFYGPVCG